uniref:Biogenesis of lysosome-related organelles complex 1 subunit 1 n=1 Tax=Ornithodoros turicata TaxID=34597 RepID=A0A2R5L451_9ACAR
MLSSLLKEHQQRQHLRREEQEKKKKDATAAANALTSAMVDHLNVGVAQAYLNQKKLDAETKQLHTNANNFAKQTTQWLHLIDNFNHALKVIHASLYGQLVPRNPAQILLDCDLP